MKKTYLAPTSETLMAILKDMCGTDAPSNPQASSYGGTGGQGGRPAPRVTHTL